MRQSDYLWSKGLKNQAELSVVASCILALPLVTTNRLPGALRRGATGINDKYMEINKQEDHDGPI